MTSKARAGSNTTCRQILASFFLIGICSSAANAETNFTPIITIGGTYTDNVSLAGAGNEQTDILLEVTPGFLLESEEERLDIYTEYSAQALFYSENSTADEIYQQADLEASLKIVPERLFLEATGSHGQHIVDPEQNFSFSNLSITSNRTDATQYTIGPRLIVPVASTYTLQMSGRHLEVLYDDPSLVEASGQEGDFSFGNFDSGGRFTWEAFSEIERLEYDIGPEVEYQQAALRVRAGPTGFGLIGLGGIESDFETPGDGSLEDEFWEAGFAWTGSNHELEAAFGERSFGKTYRFSLATQTNDLAASISYSEKPSSPARVQLERRSFTDTFFDRFLDRPGTSERFVRKLLEADLRFPLGGGDFTVSGSHERRDDRFSLIDMSALSEEELTTFEVDWTRELGIRTAVDVNGSWARRNFGNELGEDTIYELSTGLIYQFGRRSTILLRYAWKEQDSDGVSNRDDYTENVISLYFIWSTGESRRRLGSGRPSRSFN